MKKIFFLLLFIPFISFSQTDDINIDWILKEMKILSPDIYKMLSVYEALPDELSYDGVSSNKSTPTFFYVNSETKKSTLETMSTNVHEIGHGFFSLYPLKELNNSNEFIDYDVNKIYTFFYLSRAQNILNVFPADNIFPSKELISIIPKELRTFRFEPYIDGDSSTQGEGIVGLLNEFNAYYLGSKFEYDMYPIYKELFPDVFSGSGINYFDDYLNTWISSSQSIMTSFFEFDFFIKEYLLFAKNNYPELHNQIYNNASLMKVYKLIYNKFKKLIKDYSQRVNHLKKTTKIKLSSSSESEFWEDDYIKLFNQLKSSKYNKINSYLEN